MKVQSNILSVVGRVKEVIEVTDKRDMQFCIVIFHSVGKSARMLCARDACGEDI